MAWVKMRTDLLADPRIVNLSALTARSRVAVIGALYVLWSTADTYTVDGRLHGYTPRFLDEMVGIPGFSGMLISIGWLEEGPNYLQVPRFHEHNGQSAKARAQGAERLKRYRNATSVSKALPDKNKSKSKSKKTTPTPKSARAATAAAGGGGDEKAPEREEKAPELERRALDSVSEPLAAWAKLQARRPEWLAEGLGWIEPEVWLWLAEAAPAMTADQYANIIRAARDGKRSLRNPAGYVISRILELGKRAKPAEG